MTLTSNGFTSAGSRNADGFLGTCGGLTTNAEAAAAVDVMAKSGVHSKGASEESEVDDDMVLQHQTRFNAMLHES
jgi:hypothetical protein